MWNSRVNWVERDKWYFIVDCGNCARGAILREASSPDELAQPRISAFLLKCSYCGHKEVYQSEQLQCHQGLYL